MYKTELNPASILIVKTSSLGDIIQTFNVLSDLKRRFPHVAIDWAVEAAYLSIVAAHPLVRRAIPLDIRQKRNFFAWFRQLRRNYYDLIFDFQGNCKSGIFTLFARGGIKIGYGLKSVREWPNIFATHLRYNVSKRQNIRLYYLGLIEQYFGKKSSSLSDAVRFVISGDEQERLSQLLLAFKADFKIMVCPGSKWINKQLSLPSLTAFLKKIAETFKVSFLLVWGSDSEKVCCHEIESQLSCAHTIDRLSIPAWQNLMNEMDLVIAVDSSALHLCGTTSTPSFSIFGPTSAEVFKPIGTQHYAFQGPCPYQRQFDKQCPELRSCATGSCVRDLTADQLFATFMKWFSSIDQSLCISRLP